MAYTPNEQRGFSLIELMVAMVIGLVVLSAVTGIFLSSQRTYRTTEGLGRVQESMQFGFELMARDLREAGGNPCDVNLPIANVADQAGANWWTNWAQPLRGFDNGALAGSAAATDAVQLLLMGEEVVNVVSHVGTVFSVDDTVDFEANDVLMACDMRQLAVFRAGGVDEGANTISHSHTGNCSDILNVLPAPCDGTAPAYLYAQNSVISGLRGVRWFVADNANGGRSLFRAVNGGAREEMVEGVQNMQVQYLQGSDSGSYVDAGGVTNWQLVSSLRIVLTAQSSDAVGTDDSQLVRRLEHVVNLRNRTP
ncbi:prepilin-type N-terminal cleavage/methylation domain-containing protein [Luteimonas viscosa]|uniref:prepilin-type N-terminal cleavage/methylation domain-containing protein n=1 Tax=Luteimonas viscosa TaxID=1132694 RepID=UPI0016547063|nr:prepilin-type N-terminal cleavage/methylation domain-containing protein [Luteimonas viscosa]